MAHIITQLSRKAVRSYIRQGWTEEDFLREYECSLETFRNKIHRLYNSEEETDKILKEIAKNDKKPSGRKPKQVSPNVVMEPVTTEELTSAHQNLTVIITTPEPILTIDELKSMESELSSQKMAAETRYFDALKSRKTIANEIRECETKIEEILSKCDELVADANAKGEEANLALEEISKLTVNLDDVRNKIEERKHIAICVYANGTIAPLDADRAFEVADYDEALFLELVKNEECKNLTVISVHALARMLKTEQNSDLSIEWVCDDDELNRVYHVISVTSDTETR